ATTKPDDAQLLDDTTKKLAPASTGSINSMQAARGSTAAKTPLTRKPTIRSVPSFEGSDSSPQSKQSGPLSSTNSSTSVASAGGAQPQDDRTPQQTKTKGDNMTEATSRWSGTSVRVIEPPVAHDSSALSDVTEGDGAQWDSTIGKAGLGKTGRVINKLVSDNDALKRDIQIERLRAEEAKQAAKLIEDKMERMVQEYEGRLLEANVTKTLLSRKERQVESLTASVELEKKKAQAALESERNWRDEMDKVRSESKVQVEKASTHAQLMEGRYNAISSHWRDQGDQVKRAMTKMRSEIATIVDERKGDDDKIQTLRDLCEQQDCNIKELRREKEEMSRLFEAYKKTQDDDLHHIKTSGAQREEEQERQLTEARDALHKLRWALNVKKNVEGAE
ncbi:hypothetical protein Golomagni_06639, partial [Golovinomyces magnicellulatus]